MAVPVGIVAGIAFTLTPYLIHGCNMNLILCCGLHIQNVFEKMYSAMSALILPITVFLVGKYVFMQELFLQQADYQSSRNRYGNKISVSWALMGKHILTKPEYVDQTKANEMDFILSYLGKIILHNSYTYGLFFVSDLKEFKEDSERSAWFGDIGMCTIHKCIFTAMYSYN